MVAPKKVRMKVGAEVMTPDGYGRITALNMKLPEAAEIDTVSVMLDDAEPGDEPMRCEPGDLSCEPRDR